ncbi:MAG: ORF6N domain-containing protein [Kiritimatiellae bacterium]|nr:ORF6N domain-containing protein [Kiritimatiellia bacterium]
MNSRKAESGKVATASHDSAISYSDVQRRIVCIRDMSVIIDVDVAALYGVETKHVNQAVRNNRDKFPADYVFELTSGEVEDLRSKILTTKLSSKSRVTPKAFTEKALYMLATILKRKRADKMRHFGETLADVVMPDLETVETESSLELNFFIGKSKHTVRRIRKVERHS